MYGTFAFLFVCDVCHDCWTLRAWKTVCLTVSFRFEVFENDEAEFWAAKNLRNQHIANFEALARSTTQLIMEVIAFKKEHAQLHGEISSASLSKIWKDNVQTFGSALQDDITDSWIEVAVKIYNRLLSKDRLFDIIKKDENKQGKQSVFNRLLALDKLVVKCKTDEQMHWCMSSMMDLIEIGEANLDDFGVRALAGKNNGGGNRGLLDMFNAKYAIVQHIMKFVSEKPYTSRAKDILSGLSSHYLFRAKCGGGSIKADVSWQGTLPESAVKTVSLLQATLKTYL